MQKQSLGESNLFGTNSRDGIDSNFNYTGMNFMFSRAGDVIKEKRHLTESEMDCFSRVGRFIDTLITGIRAKASIPEDGKLPLISESRAMAALEFVCKDISVFDGKESIAGQLGRLAAENGKILKAGSTDMHLAPEYRKFIKDVHQKYLNAMLRQNYESLDCMPPF